jgi:hypothetical protein
MLSNIIYARVSRPVVIFIMYILVSPSSGDIFYTSLVPYARQHHYTISRLSNNDQTVMRIGAPSIYGVYTFNIYFQRHLCILCLCRF